MEPQHLERLRNRLTRYFAVIACLTSVLVANSSSGSIFLPGLVLLVTVTSYVLVEWKKVFHIDRLGSYVGMSLATVIALTSLIVNVFRGSEAGQLTAVAGLLIYPQCVLFFQRKSIRVFEQLAIFFLLQMIVAALINDNYVYGLLLTPILLLWVASLLLFARYAMIVDVWPEMDKPVPLLYELVYQRILSSMRRPRPSLPVVGMRAELGSTVPPSQRQGRLLLTVPLAVAALAFAAAVYYLLPRTKEENLVAFEVKQVGLSEQVSVGVFGKFLSNPKPLMRIRLTTLDGQPYRLSAPPYLRVGVVDRYNPPQRPYESGYWVSQYAYIPRFQAAVMGADEPREAVRVEVGFRRGHTKEPVCVPPLLEKPRELDYRPVEMVFRDSEQYESRRSLNYQFVTLGFFDRQQVEIVPDFRRESASAALLELPSMPNVNDLRLRVLRQLNLPTDNPYRLARGLEEYLKHSGEYSYTLDIPAPINPYCDPIEDFLINTKTGLCQSYAAGLVTWLRQSDIPARIVVGYLPVDFNKLGQHFIVKQSDAHAWVEAHFARDQLVGTELEPWLGEAPYYWVRLDASPAASDEQRNIVASSQSLEYAEKLWEDYVGSSDRIHRMGLYENVADSGREVMNRILAQLASVRTDRIGGLARGPVVRLVGPIVLAGVMLSVLAVVIWQFWFWLPKVAPNVARRLGIHRRRRTSVKQLFFARCLALLESVRLYPAEGETMQEFEQRVHSRMMHRLSQEHSASLANSLSFLRRLYYEVRFGRHYRLTTADKRQIEQHLEQLESAVRASRSRH